MVTLCYGIEHRMYGSELSCLSSCVVAIGVLGTMAHQIQANQDHLEIVIGELQIESCCFEIDCYREHLSEETSTTNQSQ